MMRGAIEVTPSNVRGECNIPMRGVQQSIWELRSTRYIMGGGCHAPARPYAPVSKPGLLDEGRVPRGVQGRAGA